MVRRSKKTEQQRMPADFTVGADHVVEPTPERLKRYGELPDTFRSDTGREVVRVSVVDWLFSHERISGEAYSAAYRLLGDWYKGGLSQHVTADMARDIVDNGAQTDAFNVSRIVAARHYAQAIGFLGPVHSHPFHEMVEGDLSPVTYGQKFLRWKDRAEASAAAKQRLADALEMLKSHYSPPVDNPRNRSHAYLSPGAKPAIS